MGMMNRIQFNHHYLVGGFNPSERYELVSWDHYSQYMDKHVLKKNHQPDSFLISWRPEKIIQIDDFFQIIIPFTHHVFSGKHPMFHG
jgi:hypothetical protein